jgi:zinc protease
VNPAIHGALALLTALAVATPALTPAQAPPPAAPRLLALPANDKAAVAIQLRFRTGAVDDPPGRAGLTALAARVMVEGGAGPLDATALLGALFPIAAELDVVVDEEQTTFTAKVHRDALGRLLPILTDVLLHPRWDPREFERLRAAAVNDVDKRLRQGDDENLGKAALSSLLYRGHPYQRLRLGHVSELKAMTLEELKAHAARVFTADRLTIGVAGGYPAGLPAQLVKALSGLAATGAPAVAVPQQQGTGHPRFLLVEKPGASTAISMGMPWALSRASPDRPAMSVAASAMGEHRQFNGRLMQRLREARGLNYGDYAYLEHFLQEGGDASSAQTGRARHQQEFSVWLRPVQNENRLFAVRAALYELQRSLQAEPFTPAEVAQTKGFLDGYLLLFDQTDARKLGYALDDAFTGPPGYLAGWRQALDAVTPEAVNAAWRRWVDPSRLQVVLVGPDMAAVKQAILANQPTPITYQDASVKRPQAQLDADAEIARFPFGTAGEADVEIVPVEKLFE